MSEVIYTLRQIAQSLGYESEHDSEFKSWTCSTDTYDPDAADDDDCYPCAHLAYSDCGTLLGVWLDLIPDGVQFVGFYTSACEAIRARDRAWKQAKRSAEDRREAHATE